MGFVTGGLEILAQQRHRPAVKLSRGDDGRGPRCEGEHGGMQGSHARGGRQAGLSAFELGHRFLEHVAVGVRVAPVVVARTLALRDRVVVVEVGVHVHRGGTQVGRQWASRSEIAAGVHGARWLLHRSFVRPA